ncbi:GTPase-associated protein 1-related protein, partial [Nocardiopsis halotolerans]|uniref:GTPase-associated protein 1-related protein n=1 Tax=Nocardiopsis halotolerans TaxID=124252 RepID=UPI00036B91DF
MGFAQLYYTSCEHGLSGYAGYQFNAATPGVDPRVLREIERFTVYEPPRSLPFGSVDEHPVNLCYSPDVGGVPVLSRVVSSGDDPSGRPGNYFAHSLVSVGSGEADPLPAELWEADFWAEAPVGDPGLSELAELSASEMGPGPLDRARTDAWVRRWPTEVVARLLLAADDAVDDARPLVLVADSASVAHWVAALSHLLSPGRARSLSFATYCGNPDEALVHVVGVPPGSDTMLWRGRFTVYDPETDSTDELPEPDARAWLVADRLARLGTRRAAALWRGARPYASGREGPLADWLPVLIAASLLGTTAHTGEDLRRVCEWLSEAVDWLVPEDAAALVHRVLDADAAMEPPGAGASGAGAVGTGPGGGLDQTDLAGLQRVAHRLGGAAGITERLERVVVRRCLDDIAAGGSAPAAAPTRTESVREAARDRVAALLDGERGEITPDRAVELLRWARASGLVPSQESLERYGGRVLAPLLAASHLPAPEARALVASCPGMRRGAAMRLAELPRDRLSALMVGPVGALFAEDRDGTSALLRELRLLGTDSRSDPPGLLSYLVSVRREGRTVGAPGIAAYDLDEDLLTGVWGPGHGPRAALLALRVLRAGVLVAPGVGGWVAEAMTSPPRPGQERAWRELVDEVSRHWVRDRLPEPGRRVLVEWAKVRPVLVALRAADEERIPDRLAAVYGAVRETHPAVEENAWRLVVRVLLGWRRCALLAEALRDCPTEVFEAYCAAVALRLADDRPDTTTAALVYLVARDVALAGHGRAEHLDAAVLAPAVGRG